jgi:hypothetical protein
MSRKLLYILSGVVALIVIAMAIVIFVILPSTISAKSAQTTATPTVVSTPTKIAKPNPLQQAIQQNAPTIKTQLAQGFHLTTDQLKTQLKAGQSLDSIATSQGVSSDQLQTLIHDAFEQNLATAVSNGSITQKQVDNYVQRLQKNHTMVARFLGAGGKKSNTSTATPTPTTTPTAQ